MLFNKKSCFPSDIKSLKEEISKEAPTTRTVADILSIRIKEGEDYEEVSKEWMKTTREKLQEDIKIENDEVTRNTAMTAPQKKQMETKILERSMKMAIDRREKVMKDIETILASSRKSVDKEFQIELEKDEKYDEVMNKEAHVVLVWMVNKIEELWEAGDNKTSHINITQKAIDDFQIDEKQNITTNLNNHRINHEKMVVLTETPRNDILMLSQLLDRFGRDNRSTEYYQTLSTKVNDRRSEGNSDILTLKNFVAFLTRWEVNCRIELKQPSFQKKREAADQQNNELTKKLRTELANVTKISKQFNGNKESSKNTSNSSEKNISKSPKYGGIKFDKNTRRKPGKSNCVHCGKMCWHTEEDCLENPANVKDDLEQA